VPRAARFRYAPGKSFHSQLCGCRLGARLISKQGRTAALATFLVDELRLDVGQPDTIRPAVGIHLHPMRAFVIGAVDQDVTDAG
jgi:hypothetical protein